MKRQKFPAAVRAGVEFATRSVGTLWTVSTSALLWVLVLSVGGPGLIVYGVFLMAGLSWALIAAGAFAIVGAIIIGRGMNV